MKRYDIKINGKAFNVDIESVSADNSAKVVVNGKEYLVQIAGKSAATPAGKPMASDGTAYGVPASSVEPSPSAAQVENVITSPLPGVIIGINVSVGDKVVRGQCLATLEAMKMENAIEAECSGIVKKIYVNKGDSILEGAKIVKIG